MEKQPIIYSIDKRSYAAFNRERMARMAGRGMVADGKPKDLDLVMQYAMDRESRERDQFNPSKPEAMEAQIFAEWVEKGGKF